jgi:hypothetical protein
MDIHEPRTHAERILVRYFGSRGWLRGPEWQYEPELDGRRRRPDFRLRLGGWRLMLEVKEFGRAASAPDGPRRGRFARAAAKIHLAQRQLREYRRDHLCAAVLMSGADIDADVSDPAVAMGALLGDRTFEQHRGAGGLRTSGIGVGGERDAPLAAVLTLSDVHGGVGLRVMEHPLVRPRFPSHLFEGPRDERWEIGASGFARVFAGAALRAAEAPDLTHSAA